MRRRAGLTQTELSIAVGYSTAQISRLEQNLRPPDLPTIEARFAEGLGLEDEPQAIDRLLELAANVRREDAPAPGLCPYKGMTYFDEADADLFVGREALTAKLLERVLALAATRAQPDSRFLAIVGASGSGKSSLMRAGLVPALRWDRRSADWRIQTLTPTARPLESLARNLTDSVAGIAALMDDMARDPRSLHLFAGREIQPRRPARLLLLIDQFEELFSLCRSEDERTAFIENLMTAAREADGPVVVIITLRADFYAHCAAYPELREALAAQQDYIGGMTDTELRRAIEEPANRGHWEFEPGLVDLLLHDVGHEPGALPLLSHALLETWQRRRGRMMTLSGYAASGGVHGAIAETAEEVYTDQFSREQQAIARRIFLRLTELGDETAAADTRRRATFDELVLKPEETETTRAVLTALADARLITISQDAVEVAHEALIREWPTLREWVEDNREGLRLHRHLTEAAQEWERSGRDPDSLYRGSRLVQASGWAEAHGDDMNQIEQQFLNASIAEVERAATEREGQSQIQNALKTHSTLIVAMYSEASEAMAAAAQANPDRRFLGLDSFSNLPMDNFWQQAYATDQPAFLAGYAAAFMTRTGKVGTFGGAAKKSVEDFMDGFARGVSYYNDRNGTSVQVLGWDVASREGLFIGSFTDAGAATAMTQRLLDEGADIILQVAGVFLGKAAMRAVQQHGNSYVIGVDQDWATVYPEYSDIVLTSIEKRWGVSEGMAVAAIENFTFRGGTHLGTLETGEVALAPFYKLDPLISPKVKADLDQIKADIIAGKIKTRP